MFEGDEKKGHAKFLPGNKFWRNRVRQGALPMYETPEKLFEACMEYFDWVDDNPMYEAKAFSNGKVANVPHARAMTLRGLCAHIGMTRRSWGNYRDRPEFSDVCEAAEDIMFEQKFAGAASGLFSAVIIARDLGLSDRKEVEGNLIIEVVDSYEVNDSE